MKSLIADVCVSILRKLGVSVMIGYRVEGELASLNNVSLMYDNELGVAYYLSNGERFEIPNGKFNYTRKGDN